MDSLAAAGISFAELRDDGSILFHPEAQLQFGVAERETATAIFSRVPRASRAALLQWLRATRKGGRCSVDISLRSHDGTLQRVRLSAQSSPDQADPLPVALVDITGDFETLEETERDREHLRYTVELNPQLPWLADANGKVLDFTDRWLSATGLTREEALGDGWISVIHEADVAHTTHATLQAVATGKPFEVRFRARLASGELRWMRALGFPRRDDKGQVIRWYGYTEDIHDYVLVEQSIQWNADHDSLTSLPNRSLFNRTLENKIADHGEAARPLYLLLIDVDNFKDVNDVLGHDAGDALLEAFGRILVASLPAGTTIGRIGGDEFAVLLDSAPDEPDVAAACTKLFAALQDKIHIHGRSIECKASIGASIFPQHGRNPTELLKNADIALYEAKNSGRGRLVVFRQDMKLAMQRRLAMINLGRQSAEDGSIIAYYQPQVSMTDGSLVGFEALLRRRDRRGRIHLPGSIIAAFDDLDVAEALGNAMLNRVIEDLARWRACDVPVHNIAINVSTAELRNDMFAEHLVRRLDAANIPYDAITIEVTEGVFLGRSAKNAIRIIGELSRLGFSIALDDFGTGYASLSHLRRIPVNILKVDRSFVSELEAKRDDRAIVSAIIHLGDSLGLKVVAEGIETTAQAELLRTMGCRYAQGFLCGLPTPSGAVQTLVREWRPDLAFLQTASDEQRRIA